MIYGRIKNVEKPVSRLIFGCANARMIAGGDASEALDAAMALGINTFDTAENYGLSEVSLGNWIRARGNRRDVVLISKGCHPYGRDRVTPEDLRQDLEQSFERLGTDFIDVYLLHRDDRALDPAPIVEVLNEYHRAGRIGAFGGSNWTHERIALANQYAAAHGLMGFTVSSPGYSLARMAQNPWVGEGVGISGPENRDARAWYAAQNMPVIAYSSLGRGFFSGKIRPGDRASLEAALDESAKTGFLCEDNFERLKRAEILAEKLHVLPSQIALAFLLAQDLPVYPIVTSLTPAHIAENAAAAQISLSAAQCRWLDLETDETPDEA